MNDRTLFLSFLILCATVVPSGLLGAVAYLRTHPDAEGFKRREEAIIRRALPLLYVVAALSAVYVTPQEDVLTWPAAYWYPVALAVAPAVVMIEIAATFVGLRVLKQRVGRIVVNRRRNDSKLTFIVSDIVIGTAEEVIYRGIWIVLLVGVHSLPVAIAVLLAATSYGFGHSYFGAMTVLQKTISGAIYGSLFIAAGYALIVPILVHLAQNATLAMVGNRTA